MELAKKIYELIIMIGGLFGAYHLYHEFGWTTTCAVLVIAGASSIAHRKD